MVATISKLKHGRTNQSVPPPHRFSYRFLRLPVTEDWNLTWRPELDLTSSCKSVSSRDRCRSCNAFRRGEYAELGQPVRIEAHLSGAGGAAADPPRGPPEGRDCSAPDVGLRTGLRILVVVIVVEGLPVALISANMRLEFVIRAMKHNKQLWPSG